MSPIQSRGTFDPLKIENESVIEIYRSAPLQLTLSVGTIVNRHQPFEVQLSVVQRDSSKHSENRN